MREGKYKESAKAFHYTLFNLGVDNKKIHHFIYVSTVLMIAIN